MRPRVFPAEDVVHGATDGREPACFNEAAGIPRGRLPVGPPDIDTGVRFNEAAGIPRGRLDALPATLCRNATLQ